MASPASGGGLPSLTAPVAHGAVLQQGGPGCALTNCVQAGEQYTTVACQVQNGQQPTEFVIFRATRTGSGPYSARVCLVDFTNTEVSCEEVTIPISRQSDNFRLFAPVGVNVWKVRWYSCATTMGSIEIQSNDCVYSCCTQPLYQGICQDAAGQLCPSQPCNERSMPTLTLSLQCSPPQGPSCNTFLGTHNVKVQLQNAAPVCRRIQYWWEYTSQCVTVDGPLYGISVPANSTIFLCFSLSLMSSHDKVLAFQWTDLSSYSGFADPNNGWTALVVGNQCCLVGQSCVGPWTNDICVSPFGLPSCPQ